MARILIICNVVACFGAIALRADGADQSQTQPSAVATVSQKDSQKFAAVRITAQSQNGSATAVTHSDVVVKDKVASTSKSAKTKAAKPKKQAAKKVDSKPQSDGSGLVSWLWTDRPGAPSIRSPKNGSGNWPKFK